MTYEERTRLIFQNLTGKPDGILLRYQRPRHLSDASARAEINDMVDDLNSVVPSSVGADDFAAIFARFRKSLRVTVTSRSWPTIAQAVRAMTESVSDAPLSDSTDVKKISPADVNAARIRSGELVGDYWLTGKGADILLARGMVTNDQINSYRDDDGMLTSAGGVKYAG